MAKNTTDKKTLDLIKEVKKRKDEIANAEKPNWKTNCSFSYDGSSKTTNIHVESNVSNLVSIVAFLMRKQEDYDAAVKLLSVEAPEFKWNGFSVGDWTEDIKTRIDKIQIVAKRQKLEALESRLNKIISPELRAQLELEAIEAELC
jgi:hypothetical protein